MRTFKVSDELYEQLKSYVVDPFDDTPEAVIGRLVEIVNKAKSRWSPFDVREPGHGARHGADLTQKFELHEPQEQEIIL